MNTPKTYDAYKKRSGAVKIPIRHQDAYILKLPGDYSNWRPID